MPASFLWQQVIVPQLKGQKLPVQVLALEGTVWDGKALLGYQRLESIADWDVGLSGLLGLSLPVKVDIHNQAGMLKLEAEAGLNSTSVEVVSADIDLVYLNPLFKRQRIELAGEFVSRNLRMEITDNKIQSASGLLSWSGGDVAYPAGREVHKRTLPEFKGIIETKGSGEIYLGIRDTGASFDLIEGTLDSNGSAMLKVKRRLLDISEEPWPQNSREQDVVFKVKKNIYGA